ncbi:hypothetical protein [Candidatus Chrysopegis kryptomonas]|uniref:Uncharacterized protein n=1 Tax=Candidatus Chryseopegocella kryptomonas TaxID=1633643 RepID=A0A0P1MRA3_9BACT|nr:hypothetical protein [Candidatus Chrysopegis kryptomonas]CUS98249.1 hypothetical protein JGI23_00445 [Candidatus Chrysopegis kryptomonas]
MNLQSLIKYVLVLLTFLNSETFSGIKEAIKFAREGLERAVELAPKVKKRKSFDSRSFYPGEAKIFYRVSIKRDTTNEVIIKSTGYSEIDEASFEIKISNAGKIENLEKTLVLAWEMLNRKSFIKAERKTDKIETKIGGYDVEINVKFEGSEQAEVKIAKIKIKVSNPDEKFESATIESIRRYKVSDGSFF